MKKIILDTDFLIHCATAKIDYVLEIRKILDFQYELFIIDKTLDELDLLIEKKKGKVKAVIKLAKTILKAKRIPKIETKKDKIVDKLILDTVNSNYLVATMDAELKRKLKTKGIPRIIIRQRKYLLLQL